MKLLKRIVQSILFQHLLFWTTAGFLLVLPDVNKPNHDTVLVFLQNLSTLVYIALAVYINLILLIPKFLRKRSYFVFILFQLANIFLFFCLDVFTGIFLFNYSYENYFDANLPALARYTILFLSEALLVSFFITTTTFIKLLRDWFTMQDDALRLKEMERQKLESELQSLKSQINPHFLFNTLNNIYSLALDNSVKTPEMILKLSELMRYIIYDCREVTVPLRKEIEFIQNYISLEQLRLGGKTRVTFESDIRSELNIAPLLFINFLENAFKHSSKSDGSFIHVHIAQVNTNSINFIVENSKDSDDTSEHNPYSGIGLENVKKRLQLLYPKCYTLEIEKKTNIFRINLTINCL